MWASSTTRLRGKGLGLSDKEWYDPYWAKEKAAEHAANFMYNRERQVEHLHNLMQRPPIIVSPYDAELFGHWWYEGPWFIDYLFRKTWYDQGTYDMTHLADYLRNNPTQQVCRPSQSSWGYKGFHEYWLNETNSWIYPHLHKAAERMIDLAKREPADELEWRALNQAARELLLAQSSDWAFHHAYGHDGALCGAPHPLPPDAVPETLGRHQYRQNRLWLGRKGGTGR
jgi:1,4-alpha-glucan branching enzyme